MATLKIGLSPENLILMPHPDGDVGLDHEYKINRDDLETVMGGLNITYTGTEKEKVRVTFSRKTMFDFEQVKAYCNVSMEYWVQIKTGTGVEYFNGWAAITLDNAKTDTNTDDFRKNFSIIIHEL